jgi:hypothetical protein
MRSCSKKFSKFTRSAAFIAVAVFIPLFAAEAAPGFSGRGGFGSSYSRPSSNAGAVTQPRVGGVSSTLTSGFGAHAPDGGKWGYYLAVESYYVALARWDMMRIQAEERAAKIAAEQQQRRYEQMVQQRRQDREREERMRRRDNESYFSSRSSNSSNSNGNEERRSKKREKERENTNGGGEDDGGGYLKHLKRAFFGY